MVGELESVIIKRPQDAFIGPQNLANFWQEFNYTACPDYEKALMEFVQFEQVLKQNVSQIHYLPRHERAGLDSIYTHDPVKITRWGAILMNMGKTLRTAEPEILSSWLEQIGIPVLGKIKAPGRMEGGDVVWLNERTLAVGRGYRTNAEGIQQLRKMTATMVDRIIEVPLPHADGPDACLHLMSLISLIDRDLAVIYSRYLPVFFRQILIEKGIKLIDVPDDEYEHLGTNVLALAPRLCLYPAGNPVTLANMTKAGAQVFTYPAEEISLRGTGGPTCLTCPVLRK
ncbi:MAG: arginine deiminase family protein [Desulfobacterales bacterium]|jgi:N-dimethylarginine dimethylaminohydrolase